jgi:formate C-acetyltransferase
MSDSGMLDFKTGARNFDLEAFMKSITYPPLGMTTNLARKQMKNTKGYNSLSAPVREMLILREALKLKPEGLNDDDLIVGNYGPQFADKTLLEQIKEADAAEYGESEEYKVWSEDEAVTSGRYMLFGIYTPSHTCVDYETILAKGLKFYEARIKDRTEEQIDDYGREYLKAMSESIKTVRIFIERYQKLAEQKYVNCGSDSRKKELNRMIEALKRVPYESARDLFEALQSMWIIHNITPTSERSWASVSLGRMDQYLLPYYEEWLASGRTEEEASDLFKSFFRLLDSYGDGSFAMNIGPNWNKLSDLIIKINKKLYLRSPIVAVRMKKDTPDSVYDSLICDGMFNMGQPTFYSEEACQRAMNYRGISQKDGYSVNSCMGNIVVGKELADMWGCCVNMNLPLELAVNEGHPLRGRLPQSIRKFIDDVEPQKPVSISVIKKMYRRYIKGIAKYVVHQNLKRASWVALNRPNPFLSIFLEGCIEFGRDRAHSAVHILGDDTDELYQDGLFPVDSIKTGRGTKYHNVTVLAMGFAHAADSLSAIDELVFKKKKYSLEEIIAASTENFGQSRKSLEIYADMRKCPKYADGNDIGDENAAYVLHTLADASEECYAGNMRYLPTCHTIDANVQFGNCVYASMDSRKDGEPFGKNADAVMQVIKNTPTDLITSASKLPQYRFSGGMPIDIYVGCNILDSEENRAKFRGLLRAYFKMGGMQVQVNSVSVDLLKQAYEHPKEHPHVIVRKGGFSIYLYTSILNHP